MLLSKLQVLQGLYDPHSVNRETEVQRSWVTCLQSSSQGWTSRVAQWLRIHLPMQGTQVPSLVWEDLTCCRATKPVRHNYWSPQATTTEACKPRLLKLTHLEPVLRNKRSHRNEKPVHRKEEQPPLAATRDSPRAAMKTQRSQKLIN